MLERLHEATNDDGKEWDETISRHNWPQRLIVMLRNRRVLTRDGCRMNQKRFRRLYAQEKLQVRKRGGRKRALGMRAPIDLPDGPNERWSLDFVSDSFTDGRRFRILAIVDNFTRESLALIPDTSLSGTRVARVARCAG